MFVCLFVGHTFVRPPHTGRRSSPSQRHAGDEHPHKWCESLLSSIGGQSWDLGVDGESEENGEEKKNGKSEKVEKEKVEKVN